MFVRGKSKDPRSKESNERLKEDRISQLPDPLICHILAHLPIKDAVRTSVLSTRWRTLWLWVPSLNLKPRDFPDSDAFKSFGDRFFDSDRVSCIRGVKLIMWHKNEASCLKSWIEAAVKRKIQHLDVLCFFGVCLHVIPISLYVCETLVSLKLYQLTLPNAEFVSLPCLKNMELYCIRYPNEATFERLVSCCPVLEVLLVSTSWIDDAKVYRVHSQSLKRLTFVRHHSYRADFVPKLVIDAPLLCCLSINDSVSESIIVNNMESNAKLDISLHFGLARFEEESVSSRRSSIRSFLPGISRVLDMTIHAYTFKLFVIEDNYIQVRERAQKMVVAATGAASSSANSSMSTPIYGSISGVKENSPKRKHLKC